MRDVDFDQPVELITDKSPKPTKVATAGQAVHALLYDWPVKPGSRHREAQQALLDLFEGRLSPQEAREAFEAAADEAEIRIGGWHAKNPIAMFMAKNHGSSLGLKVPRPRKR